MEDRLGVGREEIRAREGGLLKWNDWAVGASRSTGNVLLASGLWGINTTLPRGERV